MTDGRGKACTPRRAGHLRWRRWVWYSPLRHFFQRWEHPIKCLLPGGDPARDLVLVQALENIPPQTEPRAIGIVNIHHLVPGLDWQLEASFFVPRYWPDLQSSVHICIENRPAKQEIERYVALTKAVKILGGGDIEIERAGHRKINHRAALKR